MGTFKEYWKGFAILKLENKGSVARDHLANERTFLSWLRTSLTLASVGVAMAQLFRLQTGSGSHDSLGYSKTLSTVIGILFVAVGIVILFFGMLRYYNVQLELQKGRFPVSRGMVLFSFFGTFSLVIITLGILVTVQSPGTG